MQWFLDCLQIIFLSLASIFFYVKLKQEYMARIALIENYRLKRKKLDSLRQLCLSSRLDESSDSEQLFENQLPGDFEDHIEILKTALSGEAPCNIIIYGVTGSLGSQAARIAMDYVTASGNGAFTETAPFIELNALSVPIDDKGVSEPLIGAVIEPANPFVSSAIPHVKGGAVTRAHGGILFIDEIDKLHPLQVSRLSLVLKEKKVRFSSTFYSPGDKRIPKYLHDVFQNGLPADFCLIGTTEKEPQDIPEAIRSRCVEINYPSQ